MKITKIERQQKDVTRLSVYIDGRFSFGINDLDASFYGLKEGMELSDALFESITEALVFKRAKFLAVKYISYKSRTEKEVWQKLASYDDFNDDVISSVVSELKKCDYINDEKYAESFASSKVRNKLDGRFKIAAQLKNRGVDPDAIEKAFDSYNTDEVSNAVKLIEKKLKGNMSIGCDERKKLYLYLARKGYPNSAINEAFRRIGENFDE